MTERLDAFMARANAAYYAAHDPFADFVTAPEISQVFGEILGLWAAVTWDLLGRPTPIALAEAGPGRGTLMVDALRAIERVMPDFRAAARVYLVETSLRLRAIQAARLPEAIWRDSIDDLPDGPLLLLGNEFLDALPIRQFVRHADSWAERYIGPDGFEERAVEQTPSHTPAHTPDGPAIFEVCEPARAIAAAMAERFARHPGAALFLDYGPERSDYGDSLQAIGDGRPADPLAAAGSVDLTAHVDFSALAAIARDAGASTHGPVPQGLFLARLGLFQRANRLARNQPPAQAAATMEAARRLGEPNRMGRLFKAMAIVSSGRALLPGFE